MTKNRYFLVFYLAIKRKTWATDEINGVATFEQPTFPSADRLQNMLTKHCGTLNTVPTNIIELSKEDYESWIS